MSFEDYFSDDRIFHYVCKSRAALAKRRNRRQLIYDVSGDRRLLPDAELGEDEALLKAILPPRSKWKKLDEKSRTKAVPAGRTSSGPSRQPINSLDKTVRILRLTVKWYQRNDRGAPFLAELDRFYERVRAFAGADKPTLPFPTILPIRKDPKETQCRPIATYPLAAKIAICLTNRYLSKRFDPYFEGCSFAFRMPKSDGDRMQQTTHHDAFAQVLKARKTYEKSDLWVAECDIQKFFDTVNHSVLKKVFKRLVAKVNRAELNNPISQAAIRLFTAYLDSYAFNKNVLPLNDPGSGYFSSHRMSDCSFGWVKDELKKEGLYRSFSNARIGVPQGGALSGLIANILLDRCDKAIAQHKDPRLTYARYCDDMIIIHPRKGKCKKFMDVYLDELTKLKLLAHNPQSIKGYDSSFWKNKKSKQPYKWGPRGVVPWVGFVGYEINHKGNVRVRKKSLAKEMEKQRSVVQEVVGAIPKDPRASRRTIEESVINRLIQMSVGRVRLHNYKSYENDLCWVKGFRWLNDNMYSRTQMKRLDAARNRAIRRLRRYLKRFSNATGGTKSKTRQLVFYGKPFSYYFHAIEKPRLKKEQD